MTLSEIRKSILESSNPEWLNNIEIKFNFTHINSSWTLKGVSTLYDFILKQNDGWDKYGDGIPSELRNSKSYFLNLKNRLIDFLTNTKDADENRLQSYWTTVEQSINETNLYPLKFNSPEVEFLLHVYQNFPNSFSSAFNFLIKRSSIDSHNPDAFQGAVMAYEFKLKDKSSIFRRSTNEKIILKNLISTLENKISESESELINHLKRLNDKSIDFGNRIENLKKEKEEDFSNWFEKSSKDFDLFSEESTKKISDLETAYEELLRLKKPADYWKQRASELKSEGKMFLFILVGLIIIVCIILYSLLWLTPEGMLTSFFHGDKSIAVRWTIIFITLISFLAFGIRALVKITFSSFHLSRDAEERERLTYVYLAMIKDNSIDKEDRHLIMQSLFSRADTGLLKDDSSPTMPTGNIIERVLK
jgi:hypothetical protein